MRTRVFFSSSRQLEDLESCWSNSHSTAGDKFDQAKWDALEKDTNGKVARATIMALAAPTTKEEAPKEEAPKEEPPKEEVPPAATSTVVKCPLTGIQQAVDSSRAAGLTPLIVDRSEAHLLDTFHSYKADSVLDAKMVGLEVAKKNKTVAEGQRDLRKKLAYAMSKGQDMVISCQQVRERTHARPLAFEGQYLTPYVGRRRPPPSPPTCAATRSRSRSLKTRGQAS